MRAIRRTTPYAALTAAILLVGCHIRTGRHVGSGEPPATTAGGTSHGAAAAPTAAPEADPSQPPPFAPLSDGAAHPALAGVLSAAGRLDSMELEEYAQLYGFDFSDTTAGRATVLEIHTFGVERAMNAILPPVLEQCRAPGAAAMARTSGRVTDPESLQEVSDLLAQVRQAAIAESDHAEGQTWEREQWGACAGEAADVVRATGRRKPSAGQPVGKMDRLKLRAAAGNLGSGVDALTGWVDILELGEQRGLPGERVAEVLTEQIGQARDLVKTGRTPRARRRVRSQPPHPALVLYLHVLRVDAHDLAELLAVDISDTRRARNVDLTLMAADVAVREIAPRLVAWCGATLQADAIRDLRPVRNEATLEAAADRLAVMTHWDQPDEQRRCVEFGVSGARDAIGNASDALRFEAGDYNLEPYYARSALTSWAHEVRRLEEKDLAEGGFLNEARERLSDAASWLRRQRRRRD